MKIFFLAILLLLSSYSFAKSKWESGIKKVPLIELYSSEGCSSCPPAEKWMADLINNSEHFIKFTPVNFHVDYWNQLGWIDRFSKSQFTDRQKQYASLWGMNGIYTPAFVVNGANKGSLGKPEFFDSMDSSPGNLIVRRLSPETFEIGFNAKQRSMFEVYFLELGNGLKSNVTQGENKGRTLIHNFVALKMTVVDMKDDKAIIKVLSQQDRVPKTDAFAVWVVKKGGLVPIQSVGGYLY